MYLPRACMIQVPKLLAAKLNRELQQQKQLKFRRVVRTKWKRRTAENSSKISPPNHQNPLKIPRKSSQNTPKILPKSSQKPPKDAERQIPATKAGQTPNLLKSPQAIWTFLGSNWAPKSMKNPTKINVKNKMFSRLICSWFGPHFGGVF